MAGRFQQFSAANITNFRQIDFAEIYTHLLAMILQDIW